VHTTELQIETTGRELVDLTSQIREFCADSGDGLVSVFVPHATAGLTIIELGDRSEGDLAEMLDRLLPRDVRYHHQHGSPGHGADHLLPTLLSPSLVVPVLAGQPQLGTWQYVVLVDRNRDNPVRRVRLSFVEG
jgi:secondary thiamine-phosphate synthase enzyme